MRQSWYEITNKAGDEADIYIYDEVGSLGITAQAFVNELKTLKARILNLFINSPGGAVFDAMAIYNSLKRHPAMVNVFVDGIAASSASFITQAGERVVMAKGATMMIHEPYAVAIGNSKTMKKMVEYLNKVADGVSEIYAARAGGEPSEWRERMQAETWYRAQEAVDAGLADEVQEIETGAQNRMPRVFNLSKFQNVPEWLETPAPPEAPEQTDESAKEEQEMADENEIRQALGIGEDADTVAAIKSLQTKVSDLEIALNADTQAADKGELIRLRRELSDAEKRYLSQESDWQKRIIALEEDNRHEKAERMVDAAIAAGRVQPALKEMALKLALRDPKDFEEFVAKLPGVDLSERGVATDADMAALEPTAQEIEQAKQMGVWSPEYRARLMREKAVAKGLTPPEPKKES